MQSTVQKKTLQSCMQLPKLSKACPIKSLRDFQGQQFETPSTLLAVHYHRILHCLGTAIAILINYARARISLHVEINREDYSHSI